MKAAELRGLSLEELETKANEQRNLVFNARVKHATGQLENTAQIKALQKNYGKDRQRMALEMQKLQKEHGFNPILGCLPMLA